MNDQEEYTVIISNQAKRMLVSHIRFMTQVDREAAVSKKKEFIFSTSISTAFSVLQRSVYHTE